ncbi:MAG: SIS domain-containing protein [Nanoarchaeota archaeon]|nr:SIS domain-containing protein [Nanoarchaeota archaeon]
MRNKEYIEKYLNETKQICDGIDIQDIDQFIEILFGLWRSGKKLLTMGNGGSSSTASHIAADLAKTVANDSSMQEISSTKGFKTFCLNDNPALLTAWINDSGWDKAYSGILNTYLEEGDAILLVSVHGGSGWSGNLVEAINLAKKRGAKVLGLAGFDGGQMKQLSDCCVVVPKNSTPHTEGFHVVVQHLVVDRLRELIKDYSNSLIKENLKKLSVGLSDEMIKKELNSIIERLTEE